MNPSFPPSAIAGMDGGMSGEHDFLNDQGLETIHGAESFVLESDVVKVAITRDGGHMAPVVFRLDGRAFSPYALAPWKPAEVAEDLPVLLKSLRGDFLCLPFGPQENGPPHGETANFRWSQHRKTDDSITLALDPCDVRACVKKIISLRTGNTALYLEHRIKGLEGDYNYGSHPVLDLSGVKEGAARISVSPFRWGSVYPAWFSDPADGATQALLRNGQFSDLSEIPLESGGSTDASRYPARPGNDDLVMMVNEPATEERPFAWSAVVFEEFVWFCLKNPADFPSTLLWLSNGGRTAAPWNGIHRGRLGVEEVCSHFCDGVDVSRQNLLAGEGIPTTRTFVKGVTVSLRLIQAVAAVPAGFGKVVDIRPIAPATIEIVGESGIKITSSVEWEFVVESAAKEAEESA